MSVEAKPRLTTAEELLCMPRGGEDCELIRGELRKMAPTGGRHGGVENNIAYLLTRHARGTDAGRVLTGDTGFILSRNPDTVRGPDVAFVRAGRPAAEAPPTGFITEPPDLAVEVVSPGDLYTEIEGKVQEWLAFGCRMVWVVDPRRKTVAVHRPGSLVEIGENDVLDGGDVLPGFQCRAVEFFE